MPIPCCCCFGLGEISAAFAPRMDESWYEFRSCFTSLDCCEVAFAQGSSELDLSSFFWGRIDLFHKQNSVMTGNHKENQRGIPCAVAWRF